MTESLLKIPKRYCYKITQGASMKSLVALWAFLLFLSVSYGEEYKCVGGGYKEGNYDEYCIYFESEPPKYDIANLHCRSERLEEQFKETIKKTIYMSAGGSYNNGAHIGDYYVEPYIAFFEEIKKSDGFGGSKGIDKPDLEKPTEIGRASCRERVSWTV